MALRNEPTQQREQFNWFADGPKTKLVIISLNLIDSIDRLFAGVSDKVRGLLQGRHTPYPTRTRYQCQGLAVLRPGRPEIRPVMSALVAIFNRSVIYDVP